MKKLVVLLFTAVLLTTGCSAVKLSNVDIASNVKTLLSENPKMYNVYFDGYKYYVPKGLTFLTKEDYNATFVDRFGNKYYLYIDAISYFHKEEITYKVNNTSHFSRKISYNDKDGYIQIDEKESGFYLISFNYNYAKMEAYVPKDNLIDAVDNMCVVLRSVKFNRKVLESLIGDNILSYQEETFNLFDNTKTKEDFLDVVSKYEDEDYKDSLDDQIIVIDED